VLSPDGHLVVVGASLAGLRAVEAARREGFTGPITLIGAEDHLPYDRPPLSKAVLHGESTVEPFVDEAGFAELGVDVRLGSPASALDTVRQVVVVGDEEISYDALVIATGARPRPMPAEWFRHAGSRDASLLGSPTTEPGSPTTEPGSPSTEPGSPSTEPVAGVHSLRTADDAEAIRTALDAGARTVVIGAGFIGSEVASSARKRGLPVTIVEALDLPLTRSIGPEAGQVCADLHRANGTELRLGVGVHSIQSADGRVTGVLLLDGTLLPADLVVVGTGVLPCTEWLEGSGLTLHERDRGIVCDQKLWTGIDGVYAAGDVAHSPNPLFDDQLMRLEHWTNAAEQGAAAARHALNPGTSEPLAPVPYFWSDWYAHRIQFVGTPVADEVTVISAEPFIALYRRDERVVGALTVDGQRLIMKLRKRIAERGPWIEAVEFAQAGLTVGAT
jgi:NADPH-dependent 2,4-dienoyl-CoA reductase/sulfur reductase-like enzyme